MKKVIRTRGYQKDLKAIPAKDREAVEDHVALLEGDWSGLDVKPIQATNLWRLRIRSYRVFFRIEPDGKVQIILVLGTRRRTTTTYH